MRRTTGAQSVYVEAHLENVRLVRNARVVLREISWSVRPGERWVLAGGNGAGKTQLLKLIAGDVWPTPTGKERRFYRWQGRTWTAAFGVKEEIGYVGPERQDKYERYGWNHTVEQIVGTGRYRTDIPLNTLTLADRERIASVLRQLGIEALSQRSFLSLSYGERRLALLARTLASRSKLLLLDELLNGLDETNRERALRWLRHTTRSRLPWVLTTHRVEDVPDCVTHLLVLEAGRILYKGRATRSEWGRGIRGGASVERWLHSDHDRPGANPEANPEAILTSNPRRRMARASAGRPLLQLINASVYLDEHVALQGVSLQIHPGQCWVVHGGNGSGKTTLLRTIYGDHGVATGGRVERAGVEAGVPLQEFKTRVGLVAPHLQSDHPQELTVREVVQSGRHASIGLNDPPTAADRGAANRALDFFGLAGLASRTLVELSYGQLRRVLFARAWIRRPQLLLLDEPFSGVDGPTRRDLRARIEALVKEGTAVIMTTHRRSEWPVSATHELELARGRVQYCGPVRSAYRNETGVSSK